MIQPCDAADTHYISFVTQLTCADVESPRRRVSRPLPDRVSKFDYERSYALLESYYRVRAQHVEVFHQLTPSSVEHVWNDIVAQVLPKPEKIGS